ncbi:hypothetical protein HPB48_000972 [Haemaphysalis longicornis]|uniref:Uncharacterized protein n=1 Tax=Haemaphysalis longicornis TaxID=44386 RepID=A0A9J6GU45_HAELO|nr:hypothetical protein HPB48_000972 [Haemaphysalis longicornis]
MTRRSILESMRIIYAHQRRHKTTLNRETREHISVAPIPRNMHPSHRKDRRQGRTMALHKQYHSHPQVCYVDLATYPGRRAVMAVVVGQQGNAVSSCSVNTSRRDTGQVAITLAIPGTRASIIISDSKTALCNYASGSVSTEAAETLRTRSETPGRQVNLNLVWTPAH